MSARQELLTRAVTAMATIIENRVFEYMEESGYDPADPAEREACRDDLLDPGNQPLCTTCGWTLNMVCPECSGCGCEYRCSGWRHAEFANDVDDDDRTCTFCGDPSCDGSGYNCNDDYYETYNEGEILEWSG